MKKPIRPYTRIPNDIIRGGHGAIQLAVLCAIASRGKCFASVKTLADDIGCSDRTVRRTLPYWSRVAEETSTLIWRQYGQRGRTYTIQATFPDLSPLGSDEKDGGIGQPDRARGTRSPTKKNSERRFMEEVEAFGFGSGSESGSIQPTGPLSPEEIRSRDIKTLRGGLQSNPNFLESPVGSAMLSRSGLTPEEVLPSRDESAPPS